MTAYETFNPSFSSMNLAAQIAAGANDWAVELPNGHIVYGETKAKALENARAF